MLSSPSQERMAWSWKVLVCTVFIGLSLVFCIPVMSGEITPSGGFTYNNRRLLIQLAILLFDLCLGECAGVMGAHDQKADWGV
jgi:hypothetical protein